MSLAPHWVSSFATVDRRPIYEWARENVTLRPPYTLTGPPDLSISRHLQGPLDSFQNERVRVTNVDAPIRGGKSLIIDLITAWIPPNQPGPTRVCLQDEKAAKDHAEQRGIPTLKSVKGIAAYLPADTNKDRTKEILFPNMALVYDGPARGALQSRGYRYMLLDEVWQYKPGILAEAKGRLGDFVKLGLDKLLCLSQASDEGSDWHLQYSSGVIHEWHIQCKSCGHYMPPKFNASREDGTRWGFVFDNITTEAGLFDIPKAIPTVRFECEKCAHPHTWSGQLKSEWNRTGKYVAEVTDKNPAFRSFHWTALIDYPWAELAELYLSALNALKQGMIEPLKAFIQKYPAEFWCDTMAFDSDTKPRQIYDPLTTDWAEEKVRFMTIDQQSEGVQWAVIRAWSATGESRRLWFGKLYSTDESRAKQLEYKVQDRCVFKDSGYIARTVYAECVKYGWVALKGEDCKDFIHIVSKSGKNYQVRRSYSKITRGDPEQGKAGEGRQFAKLVLWSNPSIGDRLAGLKSGKGPKWGRPAPRTPEEIAMEKVYDRQISAQYKKHGVNKKTGRTEWYWYSSGDEHLDDCERMQVVAATIWKCLPDLMVEPGPADAESKG